MYGTEHLRYRGECQSGTSKAIQCCVQRFCDIVWSGKSCTCCSARRSAKMLTGNFMDYSLNRGGDWTCDLLVADWDNIQNCESITDFHFFQKIEISRGVVVDKDQEKHHFPCKDRGGGNYLPSSLPSSATSSAPRIRIASSRTDWQQENSADTSEDKQQSSRSCIPRGQKGNGTPACKDVRKLHALT